MVPSERYNLNRMNPKNNVVFVAFGSNVGSSQKTLERAITHLKTFPQIHIHRVSSLYKTEPVGGPVQHDFYNGVLKLNTTLSVNELWTVLRDTEKRFGRLRRTRWGPRTLDLDILTLGARRHRSRYLTIPHPRYHRRRFVLVPFTELAPNFVHPVLKKTNTQLLRQLTLLGQRVTMAASWKKSRFRRSSKAKKKKIRSSPSPVTTPLAPV